MMYEPKDEGTLSEYDVKHGQKYLYDYIKHSNQLFTHRINILLLVETILFVVFIATIEKAGYIPTMLILLLITVIINIVWLYINYKLIYISVENSKNLLINKNSIFYDPVYLIITEKTKSFSSGDKLLVFLPLLFLLAWVDIVLTLIIVVQGGRLW